MKKIISRSKQLATLDDQGADYVELFFDLVFVYAITRITSLTAHHLDTYHIFQSVMIFWLIWWGWTQFTWSLNAANTRIAEVRMMVLAATGVAFIMASSVDQAFGNGVMWFVFPYVIIRIIGIGLAIRVAKNANDNLSRIISFTVPSIIAWTILIISVFTNPSIRIWLWLCATAFDMLAGYLGGRHEGWDMKPKHFAERHGLIVIIALGESLIVAASAVSSQGISKDIMIVGGLAVVVTCLLWWSYFSWINEHLEKHLSNKSGSEQASLARDAYSFVHFLLICGIIGVAIGFENIIGNPNAILTNRVAIALGGGYIFFIGFTAVSVWILSSFLLIPRLSILIISMICIIFSVGHPPYVALCIMAVSLTILTFIEWKKCRHA